jgi:hypothetical protein
MQYKTEDKRTLLIHYRTPPSGWVVPCSGCWWTLKFRPSSFWSPNPSKLSRNVDQSSRIHRAKFQVEWRSLSPPTEKTPYWFIPSWFEWIEEISFSPLGASKCHQNLPDCRSSQFFCSEH